jgi:hypothetical protein
MAAKSIAAMGRSYKCLHMNAAVAGQSPQNCRVAAIAKGAVARSLRR